MTSLVLVLSGLSLLTYGISAVGNAGGLGALPADLCTGAGAALLAAYVWWDRCRAAPLLRLRLFRLRVFAYGAAVVFFGGVVNFGAQVILPLYFISARGESAIAAGLLVGPQVVGTALAFPLAGRLTDRYGAGPLLVAGGLVTAAATLPLALVGTSTSYGWLGAVLFVRGIGVALATTPAMTAGLAAVERHDLPDASPIFNVFQRTGASLGTAIVAVLYLGRVGRGSAHQEAAAFGFASWWLFTGALALTIPAALLLRAERRATSAI